MNNNKQKTEIIKTPSVNKTEKLNIFDSPINTHPSSFTGSLKSGEVIKGYEVKSVDDEQILNDWIGIIKQVLMQNKIISEQVLNGMFQHPDVTLMVGYFNNQPVSAGMVFVREGVAGLCFIATLSEYQRRGLGAVLVSRLIQDSFSKGANEIILQSSVAGKKLYLKLGFIPEGEISVFWKLGKY